MAATNPVTSAWFPGNAAVGRKVIPEPAQFTQPVVMQGGVATGVNGISPPVVTTPGTAGPGTAVTNTTGFDCMVYASATTGISKVVANGGTAVGTVYAGATGSYYVINNQSITVTYTGTLTWEWLAI